MKTPEENQESFTDILFNGRNKEYGAYEIRKKYEKYLMLAFCLTESIFMIGISVPLIASYYGNHLHHVGEGDISVNFDPLAKPPEKVTPPPPLPDEKLMEKQSRLLKPVIVIDTTDTDSDFGRQDILNTMKESKPVDTLVFEGTPAKDPVIIEEPKKTEPWIIVQEMPVYPGGEEERIRFLNGNMHYPSTAKELGIEGTVYIEFIVEETGLVDGVIIKKGIGGGCEEEAARVVKLMKYIPGRQAGVAVPVKFTIPIKFMLKNS